MLVKATTFEGDCGGCHAHTEGQRAAVEVGVDEDGHDPDAMGEYICAKCAIKLAGRLVKAANKARENFSKGLVMRGGQWRRPKSGRAARESKRLLSQAAATVREGDPGDWENDPRAPGGTGGF